MTNGQTGNRIRKRKRKYEIQVQEVEEEKERKSFRFWMQKWENEVRGLGSGSK